MFFYVLQDEQNQPSSVWLQSISIKKIQIKGVENKGKGFLTL